MSRTMYARVSGSAHMNVSARISHTDMHYYEYIVQYVLLYVPK